jgi:hypothetical protein
MIWTCPTEDARGARGVWTASSRDFERWTQPVLLFDPGFALADPVIVEHEGSYTMAFTDMRGEDRPGTYFRAIRTASSRLGPGPFVGISALLTPKLTRSPALAREGKTWTLIYERTDAGRLEAISASPKEPWRPRGEGLALPEGRWPSLWALPEALRPQRG